MKNFSIFLLIVLGSVVHAKEYSIGKSRQVAGMEIAAVYLQPVEMEPAGMMRTAKDSDIHLEADIAALNNNPNGFEEGSWIPYLTIQYKLTKLNSNQEFSGTLMPMVASDGPHYGDNVKLPGPGKYKLEFTILPPSEKTHFGRHVDKLTGVGAWFAPFTVEYEFIFAGIGKRGGY